MKITNYSSTDFSLPSVHKVMLITKCVILFKVWFLLTCEQI